MKIIFTVLMILFFGETVSAQVASSGLEALYGKSPEYLLFKNEKMKLLHFYSDGIVIEDQYDFKIINDKIQFGKDGLIEFHDRGYIFENIEYKGTTLPRIQNFMMLYSSLGYSEYEVASKFREYKITNVDVLNHTDFCTYIDVKNNLSNPFVLLQQYWTNTYYIRKSQKENEEAKQAVIERKEIEQAELKKQDEARIAELIKAEDKKGAPATEEKDEGEVFTIVEDMPSFPGGEEKMFEYLARNLKYPPRARENNITGRVYVGFVIGKNGNVKDVELLRGIGGGCDEEALRVVKYMPLWKPGKKNGKNVQVRFNLPLSFTLK